MAKDATPTKAATAEATEGPPEPTRSQLLLERLHDELAAWSISELTELRRDLQELITARRAEPVDAFQLTPSLHFWLRQVAQHPQSYQLGQQSAAASYYWRLQQLGYVAATSGAPDGSTTQFNITPRGREVLAVLPT
ncbi:MAG: hypothetical protein HC910_05360 [Spirulinaceae cyanobacterium SM2_1_0]|nr:hypothetical protein [Spirulinaceae cyanobacterium SM2_1_0]